MSQPISERTRLTSATHERAPSHRAVNVGVERGSTVLYARAEDLYNEDIRPGYGIEGLSTQRELMRLMCDLEGATDVFLLPTGLSALTLAITACLKAGDEVVCVNSCYGPIRRFLQSQMARFGVTSRYYDAGSSVHEVMALTNDKTALIIVESPGSLTFEIQDIPAIAAAAKARGILTLCDNTYGAGVLFKPLEHGIDMSMQALTKYVGGHSDILIGTVAVKDKALAKRLDDTSRAFSFFASADESYLAIRGLRTLHLRLEQSGKSGLELARWLEGHDLVERVLHPGLESFPGHDLFKRDFTAPNGLFSVVLKGGNIAASCAFLNALKLFGLGFSWGGFESLAIHFEPQLMGRAKLGQAYEGSLIRFYVGLEDPTDLKADIEQALEVYRAAVG
ncbi:cystathionine beta-lyase [Asticcacaulis sp. ZE23SCel15]|uniref:cystathionine beta-lyase n=1 Tax=Asticcacaulis sp. ZE23SCel15 TaxID=3059027 RepID=UPI00265EA9E0|nr:cystathionine beta-lyase [Asticcacaulis sp. ZE23SCel15]WKL58838.1 cystathionine beta-lyase [Asticcacaulis sp. ZE23SCel15]